MKSLAATGSISARRRWWCNCGSSPVTAFHTIRRHSSSACSGPAWRNLHLQRRQSGRDVVGRQAQRFGQPPVTAPDPEPAAQYLARAARAERAGRSLSVDGTASATPI